MGKNLDVYIKNAYHLKARAKIFLSARILAAWAGWVIDAHRLRDDSNIRAQSVKIDTSGGYSVVIDRAVSQNAAQQGES